MRAVISILAYAAALVAPSMAGTAQGDLPGIGTFSYGGAPAASPAMAAAR